MRLVARLYDGLIYGGAIVAALLLLAMMIIICLDVVLRNSGFQSSSHFFTFTEYGLLVVPCLGAPWLVREKGHVYVEILLMYLGPAARRLFVPSIGVACVVVCLILAWYGLEVTLKSYALAEKDMRSFDMPRWLVVGFIPLSFALMATEFLRFLWRRESPLASIATTPGEAA